MQQLKQLAVHLSIYLFIYFTSPTLNAAAKATRSPSGGKASLLLYWNCLNIKSSAQNMHDSPIQ